MSNRKKDKRGILFQRLVETVVKAFDSNTSVKVEQWTDGPDSRRDMDVLVEGIIDKSPIKWLLSAKTIISKQPGWCG